MNNKVLRFYFLIILINLINISASQEYLEFYKNKQVLITGGAGFIGSHIANKLVQAGAKVSILDNLSTGNIDNINDIINQINFIQGTITDINTCINATKNKEIVFHLAALISVPISLEDPYACSNININGISNMLEACKINKVKRFIFSSSSAVYGKQEGMCTETRKCYPESPYGYSKWIGELFCKQYSEFYNINTVILRYFNVYGDKQNPNGAYAAVVAKFKNQMKNNLPITIFGDGKQTRDFISVHEVVNANLKLGYLTPEISSEVFNIATGKSITLLDLFEQLKTEYPNYNQKIIFAPERNGDIKFSQANCTKYFNTIKDLK